MKKIIQIVNGAHGKITGLSEDGKIYFLKEIREYVPYSLEEIEAKKAEYAEHPGWGDPMLGYNRTICHEWEEIIVECQHIYPTCAELNQAQCIKCDAWRIK